MIQNKKTIRVFYEQFSLSIMFDLIYKAAIKMSTFKSESQKYMQNDLIQASEVNLKINQNCNFLILLLIRPYQYDQIFTSILAPKLQFFSNPFAQLSMSYARQLLYSIADQLGRQRKDMEPYISALQKNWYDTKDAMRLMSSNDFDKLDFPSRLSGMIMERLGSIKQVQPNQYRGEKMQIESPLTDYINSMQRNLSKLDFEQVIRLLTKIFTNIRDNITQQKFQSLKKSNQKIGKLTSIKQAQNILLHGGFSKSSQGYALKKINLSLLDQCIAELNKHGPKITFNPYEQKIISLSQNKMKYEGETSVKFNDMLAQEKDRREKLMSKTVQDRQIKVFELKPQKVQRMELQFNEKFQQNQDERHYNESIKQKLKNYGKQAEFMNKRKQQYFDLLKQPLHTETIVRVKLPNNWVWECKFAAMQTLQALVDLFHENLEQNGLEYYLYMTPPVQKLKGTVLRQTFYDLGCVPRAIFHFKCEDQIKGNIMKVKKSNSFFGFFN